MKALPVSAFAQTFASFMGDRSGFDGSLKNELEELCTSLISSMQAGHTCLRLTAGQEQLLSRCSLVSTAAETPLVLSNNRLYLARYYHYEKRLAEKMTEVAAVSYAIDNIESLLNSTFSIPADRQDYQREAARISALRGHVVTLVEKTDQVGGKVLLAKIPKHKQSHDLWLTYYKNEMKRLGVPIQLGKELTIDDVETLNPDIIYVATGGIPLIPEGIDGVNLAGW